MSLPTIPDTFFDRAERFPDELAHATNTDTSGDFNWSRASWNDYAEAVRRIGASLIAGGIRAGDRVAILASNRPEWVHTDMAAMTIGAVPLGIYSTASQEQMEYLLHHSKARLLVIEDEEHYERIAPQLERLPALGSIVMMPGAEPQSPAITSWQQFMDQGDEVPLRDVDERRGLLRPNDLGSLVYTSGTTGPPKAVMLSHDNLVETAHMGAQAIESQSGDRALSYLPLAHVAERGVSLLGPVTAGYAVFFCNDLEHLPRYMRDVRPTIFVGVPRLWEKMRDVIQAGLDNSDGLRPRLARWALSDRTEGDGQGTGLRAFVANSIIAPSLRKKLGLDKAHTVISGSAPISPDLLRFFAGIGIEIREIYGLSECGGPAAFARPGGVKYGYVGEAFDGVELQVAEDGEILIRGRNVFPGYLDDPVATSVALKDGWLCSGDLGELDEGGSLRITGRKKEMIITAGGKNVAPRHLENLLSNHTLIHDVMVVGDGKKFLTALFTLKRSALEILAWDVDSEWDSEATHEAAVRVLAKHVGVINEQLARVEQIKRYCVLPAPFAEATGELTPTRKMRRSYVCQKYAHVIDALYAENVDRETSYVPYDACIE
ncbi:MAG: long-chain fatty acid--CoA ligase [Gammaproteobacteria bacterium]|nr:long-chain fatty acid--CoA ligase [Gammaproteobacteria bacterium]